MRWCTRVLSCRAWEAQDFAEAEQQCQAALAVDPLHTRVNKELQLQLCRVQQMLEKPQEAVEVSSGSCVDLYDTTRVQYTSQPLYSSHSMSTGEA
jgi:hypothetical protein